MNMLSQLKPAVGSTHRPKLLGRGRGSGKGQTCGRGGKGQKARKGAPIRRGFEGGQTPLARRTPKFGFSNVQFRTKYEVINLELFADWTEEVSPETLVARGCLSQSSKVKILGKGSLKNPLVVKAHKFSEQAKAAIESAGGKAEVIEP